MTHLTNCNWIVFFSRVFPSPPKRSMWLRQFKEKATLARSLWQFDVGPTQSVAGCIYIVGDICIMYAFLRALFILSASASRSTHFLRSIGWKINQKVFVICKNIENGRSNQRVRKNARKKESERAWNKWTEMVIEHIASAQLFDLFHSFTRCPIMDIL